MGRYGALTSIPVRTAFKGDCPVRRVRPGIKTVPEKVAKEQKEEKRSKDV